MLHQAPVRQRAHTLSIHSQVEPAGFNSQTTRVRYYARLYMHTNRHYPQVVANTTTSVITFSILSPDAYLSYDRIKLRLDEYHTLLASDSDTIELATENGKTVICCDQANEMGQFLDQAEILLQPVIQSRDGLDVPLYPLHLISFQTWQPDKRYPQLNTSVINWQTYMQQAENSTSIKSEPELIT